MVDYIGYQDIIIEKSDGIALLTMNRPEVFNATGFTLHNELSRVWLDLGQDPEVRVAVITGAGNAFSAGGDFEMIEQSIGNAEVIASTMEEARDIVHNMINLDKARHIRHQRRRRGRGTGGRPARRYLHRLRARPFHRRPRPPRRRRGRPRRRHLAPARWHGQGQVLPAHLRVPRRPPKPSASALSASASPTMSSWNAPWPWRASSPTAPSPPSATPKRSLNQWLRMAEHTSFDYSLALEMLNFFGPDVQEGLDSVRQKRDPNFPSAR